MAQILPVTSAPNQTFATTLVVDGAQLTLNLGLAYNQIAGWWVLNIADVNNNTLLSGVPLVTGVWPGANILAPFAYLGIGSLFIIDQSGTDTSWPNSTNLGTEFLMLWDDTPGYTA